MTAPAVVEAGVLVSIQKLIALEVPADPVRALVEARALERQGVDTRATQDAAINLLNSKGPAHGPRA